MPGEEGQLPPSETGGTPSGAICDTGPVLHLHEIGQSHALGVFPQLTLPDQVAVELRTHGVDIAVYSSLQLRLSTVRIVPVAPDAVRPDVGPLQEADRAVIALAQERSFDCVVLTDDLSLRRALEGEGATVTGSVGVLVRGYATGLLTHAELHAAIEALLERSTLHLSRGFRAFVRNMVASLPPISSRSEGQEVQ